MAEENFDLDMDIDAAVQEAMFDLDEEPPSISEQAVQEYAEQTTPASAEENQQEISDEELDHIADTAIALLNDIFKYFNLGEVTVDEYEGDEGELILDITGDDLAVLIGRHGKTLDSLQFLVSAIVMRQIGFRYPVVIDVEGYKSRQRDKLESIAVSAAKRALASGRAVKLRPMSPYERRLIHIRLRDYDGVETVSEGEGSTRHVVVTPL